MSLKSLSIAVGLALLFATAHVTIAFTGGYRDTHAVLVLAIAAGVGTGALAIGSAWSEHRRPLAILIGVAMLAGELFGLLQTGERITAARELKQAPMRAELEAHDKAIARFEAAEQALHAVSTTSPRLEAALTAKTAADRAAQESATVKTCVANCRALLEQQVQTAGDEVAAARVEVQSVREKATAELESARQGLETTPRPPSGTPLADRLGVEPWLVDIAAAVLGSIGANGLAACLLAFGAHRRAHDPVVPRASQSQSEPAATKATTAPPRTRRSPGKQKPGKAVAVGSTSTRQHAARFGVECLRRDPSSTVPILGMHERYRTWCDKGGHARLPPAEIARELSLLFEEVGLEVEQRGSALVVRGVALADNSIEESDLVPLRHPDGGRSCPPAATDIGLERPTVEGVDVPM